MPPTRRDKARADPMDEFNFSQSSNDFDQDLKVMLAQQYCAKLCKKRIKGEKAIIREMIANGTGEVSTMSLELVESLKAIREAWNSTLLRYAALDDKITREISALESHKLDFLSYVNGLRKEDAFDETREQQIQGLEKIRGACEVAQQVWNKLAADQIEELP